MSSAPRPAEPIARTIIGTVMSAGDSCGCASCGHRRWPWNVMKNSRDM
jgi:hypothetical protein